MSSKMKRLFELVSVRLFFNRGEKMCFPDVRVRHHPARLNCLVLVAIPSIFLAGGNRYTWSQSPDLIINDAALNPRASLESFPSSDCAVVEGCIQEGARRLLRFTTEARNTGDADMVMGDPANNPLYHFSPCHGHYHMDDFADYRLVDSNGSIVTGFKAGFCLLDSYRWNPSANDGRVYNCSYQGIQKGWADVYLSTLDCQWVDITGLPVGTYFLEVEVNPARILVESDYSNNIASAVVEIDDGAPPANDDCANAIAVGDGSTPFNNLNATTDGPPEPSLCPFSGASEIPMDIWYLYRASCSGTVTVSLCGSGFDTKMAVYEADCPISPGTVKACDDDFCGLQSEVRFSARPGETFLIRIGGFNGAQGDGTMTIGCVPKRRTRR